jgi:CBS domain-containing protein
MQVENILKTKGNRVVTATAETTLRSAANVLKTERIGAIVVVDRDGGVVGIMSERDIAHALAGDAQSVGDMTVRDVMTRAVLSCTRGDHIDDVMRLMSTRRVRHLPVIEGGALLGMISIGDVVKARLAELESETETLREYIVSPR